MISPMSGKTALVGDYITDGLLAHGPVAEVGDGYYRIAGKGRFHCASDGFWQATEEQVALCRKHAGKACVLS